MIVRMKKVSIVVFDLFREKSLKALRGLGLVHVESRAAASEDLARFGEQKAQLERACLLLPETAVGGKSTKKTKKKKGKQSAAGSGPAQMEQALAVAAEAIALTEKMRQAQESIERLSRERERLAAWGDYDPAEIRELAGKGVFISLYEVPSARYKQLPEDPLRVVIYRSKTLVRFASVSVGEQAELELPAVPPAERGPRQVEELLEKTRTGLEADRQRLQSLSGDRARLQAVLKRLESTIEFEQVRAGMAEEGELSYLSGYLPAKKADLLKRAAAQHGWALLIEDPLPEDAVPTLVENPRWIRIIRPMFSLMETTPGYREFDISFLFLLFFSLFFAMLIGDAGYGIILLLITLLGRILMRRSPGGPFTLLFVLGAATIVWGALSGTWFGVEALARHPVLSRIVLPQIASFGANNAKTVMFLCFAIGALHLSIAHLMSFFRKLPRLPAFSELGSLTILWGMFFVVRYIVLREALNPIAVWLIAGGLLLVVLFGEQRGRFLKGMLVGLAKLPLSLLGSISSFSDIISYVRLFAVGLATVAVATNFNAMATEVGFGLPGGLISAFILFFGHTLNIVMGAMSVIVHGVRLNMLEFSGHLGMEWSGVPYKPFSEIKAEAPDGERRKE